MSAYYCPFFAQNRSRDTHASDDRISIISAPVPLTNEVNVGCDYGVGIKSFVDEPLKEYTYTYSKPGTYDVCFVAAKVDHEGTRKETVRNLKVVVSDHGNASIVQPDNGGVWE